MKILVIGGNRFFGKKVVRHLVDGGHNVTLLNRQNLNDGLHDSPNKSGRGRITRIRADRKDFKAFSLAVKDLEWDAVLDQVCYEPQDAKAACDLFAHKTRHYIFTSSQSVYSIGGPLREDDFNPHEHHFKELVQSTTDYAEAKRQCESIFFAQKSFQVTILRPPFVLGPDDYTHRLKWHIDRVANSQPIYFPDINARLSFLHSDDAGLIISQLITSQTSYGALNICSKDPVSLNEIVSRIENRIRKKAILADAPESHSPYGVPASWFMSCEKLSRFGCTARPIQDWIEELIVPKIH